MSYYINTTLNESFQNSVEKVKKALDQEGFGVLTEIDVQATMKKKLDEDLRPYLILGACNPDFAFKALSHEDKIGTMLPCNVILQEKESGKTEVSAVDPQASMQAVANPALEKLSLQVKEALTRVIRSL